MHRRTRSSLLAVLFALLLCAVARAGGEVRLVGAAALAPATGVATGTVDLESVVPVRGTPSARLVATLEALDVSRAQDGSLPEFRLALVPASGAAADLGAFRVNARGEARLRRRVKPTALGSRTLQDFEGGRVEVRRGADVVLAGNVPRLAVDGAGTSVTVRQVFGEFEYVDQPRRSPGRFLVESVTDGAGAHHDRLVVSSRHLDTVPDALGREPSYRGFLIDRAGRTVALGALQNEKVRGASLHLDQDRAAFPGGISTVEEFDGGRVEVRLSSGTVLVRGFLVPFPRLDDRPLPARTVTARGREELGAPEGGSARAAVDVRASLTESRRVETFALHAVLLDASDGPFTVSAVASSGTRTPLGTFAAKTPGGTGRLSLSTARGDELPGGAAWLSGQSLEVRDAAGGIALTGAFPTLRP